MREKMNVMSLLPGTMWLAVDNLSEYDPIGVRYDPIMEKKLLYVHLYEILKFAVDMDEVLYRGSDMGNGKTELHCTIGNVYYFGLVDNEIAKEYTEEEEK